MHMHSCENYFRNFFTLQKASCIYHSSLILNGVCEYKRTEGTFRGGGNRVEFVEISISRVLFVRIWKKSDLDFQSTVWDKNAGATPTSVQAGKVWAGSTQTEQPQNPNWAFFFLQPVGRLFPQWRLRWSIKKKRASNLFCIILQLVSKSWSYFLLTEDFPLAY